MHGLGVSFLVRRARSSWLLLACVAVMVLLTTGLAAMIWAFADGVVPAGALSTLTSPQSRSVAVVGQINASEAAADSQEIQTTLRKAWPGVGFQTESALWTGVIELSSTETVTTTIQLASLQGFSAQATLTAGTWPGLPQRGGGRFGQPFNRGTALAAWQSSPSATDVPVGAPNPYGGIPPEDGTGPVILGWKGAAGGAQQLTFNTGHNPSAAVMASYGATLAGNTGQVVLSAPPPSAAVPAIATSGYLVANKLGVGSTVVITLNGTSVGVKIVASVARFPTVFGQNQALIADLTEVNDVLTTNQASPLPVTRWWLTTTDGQVPGLPAGLGLSVTDRASQQAALLDNLLLTGPRQAMLAVGLAAVLLGVLGFSVSVAASLRSRRTQSAVFAALGVGKYAQAGQLCLEQCALSLPAAAVGLLAGIGLAQVLVPAITLTADAAEPVPWVLVIVPLGPAIVLALVTAVVPVAAAALSVLRRPDPAVRLRSEAG